MPEFTFEIKGVTLDMCEMHTIHKQYEIFSTAEYLIENYGLSEETALKMAVDIRKRMDKYGLDEETAIDEILDN